MRIHILAVMLVCGMANAPAANTCLFVDQLTHQEWAPETGSVFPNAICIFPDGRTGLNDAVFPVAMLFGALYDPYGDTAGCDWQFRGKALNFGYSGQGVVLCGGTAQYTPCESLPCSFNWYGIAGGGHSPTDEQGQPQGVTEVIWVPDTCWHGCNQKYVELFVNSPDIDGNLVVNLQDVVLFSSDMSGTYNFRSDFNFDGIINLSDLAFLAGGMGTTCAAP